jgi:hypothetical protein
MIRVKIGIAKPVRIEFYQKLECMVLASNPGNGAHDPRHVAAKIRCH